MKDYQAQRKAGKDPQFVASSIGLDPGELDYWQDATAPVSADSAVPVNA